MPSEVANRIASNPVPLVQMPQGSIPGVGMGTFGSDSVDAQSVAAAVEGAIEVGYRHFDCAEVYGNEKEIGVIFEQAIQSGIAREELWINSKVWNNHHDPEQVVEACERSLENLRVDYLDLYFVHWPFPNFHPPGCTVESRSPDARPYDHSRFMKTWDAMETLHERGLVRNLGTSNMTIPKLQLLLRDASIPPAANEMELHPHFQQPELFNFVVNHGMVPIGYCPLGSPGRPERDRTPEDTVDIKDPIIVGIARTHGIHPALVCIKWAAQRGQIPIPMSSNPKNYTANLKAVTEDPLTDEEMISISQIDKNCRLIKGQVFLWEGAKGWEDLWDIDGTITA